MSLAAGDRMEAERDLLDFRPATAQTTDASANDGAVAGAPGLYARRTAPESDLEGRYHRRVIARAHVRFDRTGDRPPRE